MTGRKGGNHPAPGYLDKAEAFAQEHNYEVNFDMAGKKADGTYEIQGRDPKTGKKIEVEIDKDGKAAFD